MNIYFDTETTGLPPKGAKWDTNYNNFPYIVQISWKRSDQKYVKDFILNNGVEIPKEATAIHGVTQEMADNSNYTFLEVIGLLLRDAIEAECIIAHNGYFDISITKANALRFIHDKKFQDMMDEAFDKDKRIDTMMSTVKFCAIPFPSGRSGFKWPKLEELYMKLFNETFPAHNSKEDVLATERCFHELVKLKVIKV